MGNTSVRVPSVAPGKYELPCYVAGGLGGGGEGCFDGCIGEGVFVSGVLCEFFESGIEGRGEVTRGAAFVKLGGNVFLEVGFTGFAGVGSVVSKWVADGHAGVFEAVGEAAGVPVGGSGAVPVLCA